MSNQPLLIDRVRQLMAATPHRVEEKKMFGSTCFMVNNKMCLGVRPQRLMIRFDPALQEEVLQKKGVSAMIMRKKLLPGYAYVDAGALATPSALAYWVDLALSFNRFAKPAKRK